MPHRLFSKYSSVALTVCLVAGFSVPAKAGFQWVSPSDASSVSVPTAQDPVYTLPAPAPSTLRASTVTAAPEIISPVVITAPLAPPAPVVPTVAVTAPAPVPVAAPVSVPASTPTPVLATVSVSPKPALVALPTPAPVALPALAPVVPPAPAIVAHSAPALPPMPSPAESAMMEQMGDNAPATPAAISAAIAVPAVVPSDAGSAVVQGFANHVPLAVALRQILPSGVGFSVDPNVDLGTLVSFRGGKLWRDTLKETLDPVGLSMHEQGDIVIVTRGDEKFVPVAPAIAAAVSEPVPEKAPVASVAVVPTVPAPAGDHVLASLPHDLVPPQTALDVAVAPAPAAVSGGNGAVVETWTADRGDSLRKVLENWTHRANVELSWMAEYDYPLQASVNVSGTFEDAVRNILTGFESAHPQPVARLHANANLGQMVLVVETRGNSYGD